MPPARLPDADGVLTRQAKASYKLISFLAGILIVGYLYVEFDKEQARGAAREVVAPVEKKLDKHLDEMTAKRERMDSYVEEDRKFRRMVARKLDALCRANPKADCPLGDE